VVEFISNYGFEDNDLPLCISLENHCDNKQQQIIQMHLLDYLGSRIYVPLLSDVKEKRFATLEQLRGKVLIQTRGDNDFEVATTPLNSISTFHNKESADKVNSFSAQSSPNQNMKRLLDPFLQSILSIITVNSMAVKDNPNVIYSISERQLINNLKSDQNLVKAYTDEHFIRVYPKATRIQSSNFEPQSFWDSGVQMCAMNFQTKDTGMALNKAFFSQNGNCGYVLKPYINEKNTKIKSIRLSLTVLSTHDLKQICPKSLFLKFAIHGAHIDEQTNAPRLFQPAPNNHHMATSSPHPNPAQSPCLQNTKSILPSPLTISPSHHFHFTLSRPRTSLLEISALSKHSLTAQAEGTHYLPVHALRTGIRTIQLMDKALRPIPDCFLLVYCSVSALPSV